MYKALLMSLLAVVTALVPAAAQAQKAPAEITLTLDFVALGRHAPWYVALAKGYYKEAGLNVKIIPAQGTAQAMQALESNIAQYAFSDVPALVLARARGASTAKMVAVNYQKAPYAIYSLNPGANITKLEQLKGLEIGSGAGSFTPKVIQGFLKEKGLDAGGIKFTNVDGAARVPMLLAGKIPAIENFILSQPGIKRGVQTGELKTMLLADLGLELYANGILVRESLLKSDPEQVRAFVQASLRGWKDALDNPEAAADLQLQYVKGLNREVIIDELKIVRDLAVTADTRAKGLGWIDAAKMKKSLDFVVQNIGIEGTAPAVTDLFSTDYLPRMPIAP